MIFLIIIIIWLIDFVNIYYLLAVGSKAPHKSIKSTSVKKTNGKGKISNFIKHIFKNKSLFQK